ncbi:MAG: hypothetical protein ACXABY_32565 [Candidatus Thorarchaeota archaeon]
MTGWPSRAGSETAKGFTPLADKATMPRRVAEFEHKRPEWGLAPPVRV